MDEFAFGVFVGFISGGFFVAIAIALREYWGELWAMDAPTDE
jgi:hypothetical protein